MTPEAAGTSNSGLLYIKLKLGFWKKCPYEKCKYPLSVMGKAKANLGLSCVLGVALSYHGSPDALNSNLSSVVFKFSKSISSSVISPSPFVSRHLFIGITGDK